MARFASALLYLTAAALGRLPWPVLNRIGDGLAWLWRRKDARESHVARVNLRIAYPEALEAEREDWHQAILRTTARQFLETMRFWTRPHRDNLALITRSSGVELFDAALASGKGLIVAAPHYGNWELLNQWLAARTPLAILYKPPESKVGEAFLRRVRGDSAERVTQIRADGPNAVRQLLKLLKAGRVTGILPDQQPKVGDGEFVPFFGKDALTMTLLGRLAARTGATVLFAYCERIGAGPEFALHVEAAPAAITDPDPVVATTALNAAVERIARRDPAQYQWTYKRWRWRPVGSSEPNPYERTGT